MIDRFTELLQELGKIFDLPLHPDGKQSCSLMINEKLRMQLELDRTQERVVIGAYLGTVPPGRFRENTLAHTLKMNALHPRLGTFGYNPYHNQLALFDYLPLENLNGEKCADFLALFLAKAAEWQEALQTGNLPVLPSDPSQKLPPR